jgi:hypothetical protein
MTIIPDEAYSVCSVLATAPPLPRYRLAPPQDRGYLVRLAIRSLRLAAQDVALSRRKQGFESPRERQLQISSLNCRNFSPELSHHRWKWDPNPEINVTASTCAKALAIFGLTLVAIVSSSAFAADQLPNMKGKWAGKTHTIVAGSGGHWPTSKGTFEKPGLFEKDLVIEVTGQEGRRFWGIQTISGNGESTQEPMIGELTGRGNRTVVIVDTDGYLNGQLMNDNVLSFCYMQAGGPSGSSVVSCTEVKRAR